MFYRALNCIPCPFDGYRLALDNEAGCTCYDAVLMSQITCIC